MFIFYPLRMFRIFLFAKEDEYSLTVGLFSLFRRTNLKTIFFVFSNAITVHNMYILTYIYLHIRRSPDLWKHTVDFYKVKWNFKECCINESTSGSQLSPLQKDYFLLLDFMPLKVFTRVRLKMRTSLDIFEFA